MIDVVAGTAPMKTLNNGQTVGRDIACNQLASPIKWSLLQVHNDIKQNNNEGNTTNRIRLGSQVWLLQLPYTKRRGVL